MGDIWSEKRGEVIAGGESRGLDFVYKRGEDLVSLSASLTSVTCRSQRNGGRD